MKMKKITALLLTAALSASALCACSSANTLSADSEMTSAAEETTEEETTEEEATEEETTEEETVFTKVVTTNPVDESCKLYDFTVKVDGNEYSVPCDFSYVEKYGFSLGDSDDQIEANCYTLSGVGLTNADGTKIGFKFWNASDSTQKYSECKVGEISVYLDEVSEVVLPGDFTFSDDTTVDEFTAQYGQPTELEEDYDSYFMKYTLDAYSRVYVRIYKENSDSSSSITICNMVE